MEYKRANKNNSTDIYNLSTQEIGWTSSKEHLEKMLEKYPSNIALEDNQMCGFIYSQPLSSDILRICNLVVGENKRKQGIGGELLQRFEKEAQKSGYNAVLFPEEPEWFDEKSLKWLKGKGYKDIYTTDKSRIVLKETGSL